MCSTISKFSSTCTSSAFSPQPCYKCYTEKEKESTNMKLHHLVWLSLCLAGNVVHLYWISDKYFKYEVATNVRVYVPDYIDAPSWTICLETWRLLDWEKIMTNRTVKKWLLENK